MKIEDRIAELEEIIHEQRRRLESHVCFTRNFLGALGVTVKLEGDKVVFSVHGEKGFLSRLYNEFAKIKDEKRLIIPTIIPPKNPKG